MLVKRTYLSCLGGEQSKAGVSVRLMNIFAYVHGGQESGLQPILEWATFCLTSSSSVGRALVLYGGTLTLLSPTLFLCTTCFGKLAISHIFGEMFAAKKV